MKFWYERISKYIRIEKNNTNECPNIFVSKKGYEYDTNEYSWRKIFEYIRISEYSTLYDMKNMIRTNIRIYSDQKNDTNEYTNIFVSKKGYEYDTNEYSWQKIFEYIRISEYSSHYGTFCRKMFKYALRAEKWLKVRWELTPYFILPCHGILSLFS